MATTNSTSKKLNSYHPAESKTLYANEVRVNTGNKKKKAATVVDNKYVSNNIFNDTILYSIWTIVSYSRIKINSRSTISYRTQKNLIKLKLSTIQFKTTELMEQIILLLNSRTQICQME